MKYFTLGMRLVVSRKVHLEFITRYEWGAHEPRYTTKLFSPLTYVRLSSSDTPPCHDPATCTRLMKALQETYMDSGFDDIPHNFLVGGDGQVYEGRGWDKLSSMPPQFDNIIDDCVDIALIGDYEMEDPPWNMIHSALNFLQYGLKWKYIRPNFKLIPYRDL